MLLIRIRQLIFLFSLLNISFFISAYEYFEAINFSSVPLTTYDNNLVKVSGVIKCFDALFIWQSGKIQAKTLANMINCEKIIYYGAVLPNKIILKYVMSDKNLSSLPKHKKCEMITFGDLTFNPDMWHDTNLIVIHPHIVKH